MIDLGISKMAVVGIVALLVIGPEKLPRVARTLGQWVGKAQRYMAEMKAEIHRTVELDELKKMKEAVENAAHDVQQTVAHSSDELNQTWAEATRLTAEPGAWLASPEYKNPNKKWRLKRAARPQWYKVQAGVRQHVQSGAARVARHRRYFKSS